MYIDEVIVSIYCFIVCDEGLFFYWVIMEYRIYRLWLWLGYVLGIIKVIKDIGVLLKYDDWVCFCVYEDLVLGFRLFCVFG